MKARKIGHDILDPACSRPTVLRDGFTVRFPISWTRKEDRDLFRATYVLQTFQKARGKTDYRDKRKG